MSRLDNSGPNREDNSARESTQGRLLLSDRESARDFAEGIVQAVREPLLVLDEQLCVVLANRAFYQHFAVSFLDTEGQRLFDLGNGQWNIPELRRLLDSILAESAVFNDFRVAHDFPGIGHRVLLLNARKVLLPNSTKQAILIGFEDVTEQGVPERERWAMASALQESADALHSSEDRYQALAGVAPLVIWASRADGSISYANQFWCDYTGLTLEQTYNDGWVSMVHPDDREHATAIWKNAVREGADYEMELRFRRAADKEYRWFLARGLPLRTPGSSAADQWFGVALDIHEGKVAADEVRAAEERLRLATKAANIGTWDLNPVTGELFWDAGCRAGFGYPLDRAIDYPTCLSLIHPEDRAPTDAAVQAALAPGGTGEYSVEFRTIGFLDAVERWVVVTGHSIFNEARTETLRFVGTIQDISERKWSEAVLRASEEQLRDARRRLDATLSAGDIGTWTFDLVRDCVVADANLARLFSVPPEAADGGKLAVYLAAIHEEDRARVVASIQDAAKNRDSYESEYRLVSPEGANRWVVARGRVERDRSGAATALPGVVVDITARKQLEEERERLLTETRALADREHLVNNVGQVMRAANADPKEAQSRAVVLIGEAIGVDRCYFAIYDPVRPMFHIGRDWHRADLAAMEGDYMLADYAVTTAELYRGGRMVTVYDDVTTANLSDEAKATLLGFRMRAFLGIVLTDEKGKMVASLRVAMADTARAWTREEVALIESVANLIHSALEAARVAQRERNIAHQLQEALQPPPPPHIPGLALKGIYRPALGEASVGGDFYDVFALENGCTALVVADLAGKGLSAASQVSTVRNMLRYALYTASRAEEAINALSRILVGNELLTGFTTLFVGLYDPARQEIRYVNCGQEPGLIWRAATGAVDRMEPTGPVLGGFACESYTAGTAALAPGDIVALFTDGLTEVGPNRRELLGIDGVVTVLQSCGAARTTGEPGEAVEQVCSLLVNGVDGYARGGVRDDVCLLVGIVAPDPSHRCTISND